MTSNSIGRRRSDPVPWSWEVPLAVALAWLCTAAWALLAGQGLAGLVTGRGWLWPESAMMMPALVGLMTGHVGAGLSAEAEGLAPALVYGLAAAVELTLLVATVATGVWVWTTYGPSRRMGMATRTEAGFALGMGRLRRIRKLIRPDLYRRAGRRASRLAPPQAGQPGRRGRRGRASVDPGAVEHAPATTPQAPRRQRFTPQSVGWRLGVGRVPRCGELWVPFDRTCGVYGPQGSGKTLDLLTPALLSAPGAALVTLTKVEDLLLTIDHRAQQQPAGGGAGPVRDGARAARAGVGPG